MMSSGFRRVTGLLALCVLIFAGRQVAGAQADVEDVLDRHLMAPYTIEGMRAREYPGGSITIRSVLEQTASFTRYFIDYPSDDLMITGIMQVPPGTGPFPVVILNHGFYPREQYWSGLDTWQAAEALNRRGYLTVAPDYRSWGASESGASFFHTGLTTDVINLVSSLETLAIADAERIGMWGHSMGGGITTKVLTIDPRVRAAVLYAPNSANDADLIATWGPGCVLQRPTLIALACNMAEILPADLPEALIFAYADAAFNPAMMRRIAPIYHVESISASIQIHIGTADTVTPMIWSENLRRALAVAGRDVTLFSYEGQGHAFTGASWALFIERAITFFDEQLALPAEQGG